MGDGPPTHERGSPVTLHVYDLTSGELKKLSEPIFGKKVEGLWHTGVVVYGREYFFEGGITSVPAGKSRFGRPNGAHNKRLLLGHTDITKPQFEQWVRAKERDKYGRMCYHLIDQNCNHFSDEAVRFLTGSGIPDDIIQLPTLSRSSAIGRLFSPLVNTFFGGWQWLILRHHLKARRRLDGLWNEYLEQAADLAPPRVGERKGLLECSPAAPPTGALVSMMDLSAADRRVHIQGRPPSRLFFFGPGDEQGVSELITRLRQAITDQKLDMEGKEDGLSQICARLRSLPAEKDRVVAAAKVDGTSGMPITRDDLLPSCEAECLVWLLKPSVALWAMFVSLHNLIEEGQGCAHSANGAYARAEQLLEEVEGANQVFKKKLPRKATVIQKEFEKRLPLTLAVLDVISRLTFQVSTARILLNHEMRSRTRTREFHNPDEPESHKQLRELFIGKMGLCASDFDELPIPIQILTIRTFVNIYASHPDLARLASISFRTVGVRARNVIDTKESALLRMTSASLMNNTVCMLNKLQTERDLQSGRRLQDITYVITGGEDEEEDGSEFEESPTSSSVRTLEPQQRPPSARSKDCAPQPSPAASPAAPQSKPSPRRKAPDPDPEDDEQNASLVVNATIPQINSLLEVGSAQQKDMANQEHGTPAVKPKNAGNTTPPPADAAPAPPKATTSSSQGGQTGEAAVPSAQPTAKPTSPSTPAPHGDPTPTFPRHQPLNHGGDTEIRNLIVRAICRRFSLEDNPQVLQRMLFVLYHCCLQSETARIQLASAVLYFGHAKRLPSMEARYLARLVEFMNRSDGPPPANMTLTAPVVPPAHPTMRSPSEPPPHEPY